MVLVDGLLSDSSHDQRGVAAPPNPSALTPNSLALPPTLQLRRSASASASAPSATRNAERRITTPSPATTPPSSCTQRSLRWTASPSTLTTTSSTLTTRSTR